jgi:hypothetical protein
VKDIIQLEEFWTLSFSLSDSVFSFLEIFIWAFWRFNKVCIMNRV